LESGLYGPPTGAETSERVYYPGARVFIDIKMGQENGKTTSDVISICIQW